MASSIKDAELKKKQKLVAVNVASVIFVLSEL